MVRRLAAILTALTLLMTCALAEAALSYDGLVVAGDPVPVTVPYGGKVRNLSLRKGAPIEKGGFVAEIGTTPVYAPIEGTVTGVYAAEGDELEGVTERYGAVMYIEPTNRYVIKADTSKAYNQSENKFIHLGETVYLCCTADGTHRGVGFVSSMNGTSYTVEVTGGEFYMEETVGIYRSADYAAAGRIGRGDVDRAAPVAVKAQGSLLCLHVKNGDFVEKGELLCETVDGVLDGLFASEVKITSPVSGVIASVDSANGANVQKGDSLVKIYPTETLLIEVEVPEDDLNMVFEGEKANIEFRWDIDEEYGCEGRVESISYLSESDKTAGGTTYKMYISFKADEKTRIGMNVTVYLTGESADETENEGETA